MGKIVNGVFYNSEGVPTHGGIVEVDGKLYYAGKGGKIIKDQKKIVHHGMANGLVRHGRYYFDKNGVIRLFSFKKPKSSKKKTNIEKKKLYKRLSIIAAIVIGAAILVFILLDQAALREKENDSTSAGIKTSAAYAIELPQWDEEVYLCTDTMKQYYQGKITLAQAVQSDTSPYQPFPFKYRLHNAAAATLLLSKNEDYANSVKYDLDVLSDQLAIDNLETGTTYYYLVVAKDENGKTHANGGEFTTANTNRFIYLPGVYNTRDIGGYQTADGLRVKQGLLYRGTELDGLIESTYYLTDEDAPKKLGIAYDFDLRSDDIVNTPYVSRLGVPHKFYQSPEYSGIFHEWNEASLREIFADLADERHYPMYLHCTYGADRTGTIVFLLQGILGVSKEDMNREYALTGFFSHPYVDRELLEAVYDGLQGVPGTTINEKIETFLVDTVGVPIAQIRQIRSIFLEKA